MGRFHRHDGEHRQVADHHHDHPDGRVAVARAADDHQRDLGDHSGYATASERVSVLERIFDENDHTAAANRDDLSRHGVFSVNVMSSPGAGKTAVLRETLRRLHEDLRIGIIEGDIETSLDADRLAGFGAAIELVNTGNGFGGECHLDAPMVRSALVRMDLADLDLLVVENVGNLVCPAEFDVGTHRRVMVFSVTEGEDKPLKYPVMFRAADVVLVNKIDLLPHLDFDQELFRRNLHAVNPTAPCLELSATRGVGLDAWCGWLRTEITTSRGVT